MRSPGEAVKEKCVPGPVPIVSLRPMSPYGLRRAEREEECEVEGPKRVLRRSASPDALGREERSCVEGRGRRRARSVDEEGKELRDVIDADEIACGKERWNGSGEQDSGFYEMDEEDYAAMKAEDERMRAAGDLPDRLPVRETTPTVEAWWVHPIIEFMRPRGSSVWYDRGRGY